MDKKAEKRQRSRSCPEHKDTGKLLDQMQIEKEKEEELPYDARPGPSKPYYHEVEVSEVIREKYKTLGAIPRRIVYDDMQKRKEKLKSSAKMSQLPPDRDTYIKSGGYKVTDMSEIQPTSSEEALALQKEMEFMRKRSSRYERNPRSPRYERMYSYEQHSEQYDPCEWQLTDEEAMIQAAIEASLKDMAEARDRPSTSAQEQTGGPLGLSKPGVTTDSQIDFTNYYESFSDPPFFAKGDSLVFPKSETPEGVPEGEDFHQLEENGAAAAAQITPQQVVRSKCTETSPPNDGAQGYKSDSDTDTMTEASQIAAGDYPDHDFVFDDSDVHANEVAQQLNAKEPEEDNNDEGSSMDEKEKK